MVSIQINVSDDLNKRISLYKVLNDFSNKEDAVVDFLEKNLGDSK